MERRNEQRYRHALNALASIDDERSIMPEWRKAGLARSAHRRHHRGPRTAVASSCCHQREPAGPRGVAPPRRHGGQPGRADPISRPGPRARGHASTASVANPSGRAPAFGRAHASVDGRRADHRPGRACGRSAGEKHYRRRDGWLGSRGGTDQAIGHAAQDPGVSEEELAANPLFTWRPQAPLQEQPPPPPPPPPPAPPPLAPAPRTPAPVVHPEPPAAALSDRLATALPRLREWV